MRKFHYDEGQLYTTYQGCPETTLAVRENQESGADCEQTDRDLAFLAEALHFAIASCQSPERVASSTACTASRSSAYCKIQGRRRQRRKRRARPDRLAPDPA
jgi:putative hemolysin